MPYDVEKDLEAEGILLPLLHAITEAASVGDPQRLIGSDY
jgi:hypothetical protein